MATQKGSGSSTGPPRPANDNSGYDAAKSAATMPPPRPGHYVDKTI
jgi:hypothetical protein